MAELINLSPFLSDIFLLIIIVFGLVLFASLLAVLLNNLKNKKGFFYNFIKSFNYKKYSELKNNNAGNSVWFLVLAHLFSIIYLAYLGLILYSLNNKKNK